MKRVFTEEILDETGHRLERSPTTLSRRVAQQVGMSQSSVIRAWFHISDYVNTQKNNRYWDSENPHRFHEQPLHDINSSYFGERTAASCWTCLQEMCSLPDMTRTSFPTGIVNSVMENKKEIKFNTQKYLSPLCWISLCTHSAVETNKQLSIEFRPWTQNRIIKGSDTKGKIVVANSDEEIKLVTKYGGDESESVIKCCNGKM
ncbi:hypothetical protein ANN_13274 [Periplaneta americana]|uniref:Uncharacterized protein n=1 Tax=Periplaneta americana TaxID=6978 RepID=A0ABQ8TJD0_PERAM|nr:hypothetical protein ANN_13274 [Periplaneta americana]